MKGLSWRSALSSYFTRLNGLVLFVLLLNIPHKTSEIGSWLCGERMSSFILHWTGKSRFDPVKRAWMHKRYIGSL